MPASSRGWMCWVNMSMLNRFRHLAHTNVACWVSRPRGLQGLVRGRGEDDAEVRSGKILQRQGRREKSQVRRKVFFLFSYLVFESFESENQVERYISMGWMLSVVGSCWMPMAICHWNLRGFKKTKPSVHQPRRFSSFDAMRFQSCRT